jgi:hypothetical protein
MGVLRRVGPWALGVAILVIVITRVPVAAFRSAIGDGPHLALAAVDFGIAITTLFTDSFATTVGLTTLGVRRRFGDVLAVRGATYALSLVNYAVGQGAFGYYLHRSGYTALRTVGATLFLLGTNFAALLIVATVAVFCGGVDLVTPRASEVVTIACLALVGYHVVIALRPQFLARREALQPLFDAGARGHLLVIAARAPHVACVVLGQWIALRVCGIDVPFAIGLAALPIVVIASVLPIAPAGLGTTQAAMVYLFSTYAVGATADDRQAAVLAFSIVHFAYSVVAAIVVGLIYLPIAKRRGVLERPASA